ncbi:hypothetical protein NFI96_003407 [Prochilodus magdalenae]|nr:hypothetical protein NFI96_003407 [Prochilodus magdalenae]
MAERIGAQTSILLLPAYKQRLKQAKLVLRSVYQWSEEAIFTLQDCFETTDWQIICDAAGTDINKYTDSITSYIRKCTDDTVPKINVRTFPNQKPWISAEVRAKPRAQTTAYHTGDLASYKKGRYDLQRAITLAKRNYRDRVESNYLESDIRCMWNGLCAIADYKGNGSCDMGLSSSTADELTVFSLLATIDHQFAYRSNRSTDEAVDRCEVVTGQQDFLYLLPGRQVSYAAIGEN